MGSIFLRKGDELVPMVETEYEEEAVLQELLERHPALLAGGEASPQEPAWLLVRREASMVLGDRGGARGFVDHLFLDAAGVLTLVEVKRSSDGRVRREVVGQMLDYAANIANWSEDAIRNMLAERCTSAGLDPDMAIADAFGSVDVDGLWASVRTNLAAERLRLVFVADAIPPELRRIVEYLNGQMSQTEVLAIEVKQYSDSSGAHETLVSRLVGQTESARQAKAQGIGRRWDRGSVLSTLAERRGPKAVAVARGIFDWVDRRGDLSDHFGSGSKDGSFQAGYWDDARYLWPFVLYTYGRIEIQFQPIARRPPFEDADLRKELHSRLSAIPGVELPPVDEAKRPSIDVDALREPASLSAFTDAMDWAFAQAAAAAPGR